LGLGLGVLILACANPPAVEEPVPAPVPVVEPEPVAVDLRVPREPKELAARLATVERTIRDPAVDDATAGRWGHLQQRIYRTLADDEVLAGAVIAALPAEVAADVETVLHGTKEMARTVLKPKTDLPDWRIVDPKPAAELLGYYREAGAEHGVPWSALAAIHLHETRMGRLRGLSDVGARGPMQFMPETWASVGEGDIESDRDAIRAAARYLARSGWSADPRKAIWAYNNTERYVNAILDFAEVMDRDERAYRGFWGWEVYYKTVQGPIWLSSGYEAPGRTTIETWCAPRGEPHCPQVHPGQ
jgi:hypothetical protein